MGMVVCKWQHIVSFFLGGGQQTGTSTYKTGPCTCWSTHFDFFIQYTRHSIEFIVNPTHWMRFTIKIQKNVKMLRQTLVK